MFYIWVIYTVYIALNTYILEVLVEPIVIIINNRTGN